MGFDRKIRKYQCDFGISSVFLVRERDFLAFSGFLLVLPLAFAFGSRKQVFDFLLVLIPFR